MNAEAESAKVRGCFLTADQIVSKAQGLAGLQAGERMTIVGSDFYGSYWLPPGESREETIEGKEGPLKVLTQALHWLTSHPQFEKRKS
jgi:hypothetical protein